MTGILDYDAGNLTSVQNALDYLGERWLVSRHPSELQDADRLIVPGDGHASTCMANLRMLGLDLLLGDFLARGRPVLGICVGSQIVLESSDEGGTHCLGLVPGYCHLLPGGGGLKVPHMGWNTVTFPEKNHPLVRGVTSGSSFYFVHSYYTSPAEGVRVLGSTVHGLEFTVGFVQGSLATWQFHPEKSGASGLRLLGNFLAWRP
jgi:glutamine amidotransferase